MWLYNYAYNYNSAGMTESQKPGYNKYTSGIHLNYMSGIYTWNILQINFKYTSNILHHIELKKKYASILCYFSKRSTFEVHVVKLS